MIYCKYVVKQTSNKNFRQALRTRPVPERLKSWIEMANSLPSDEEVFELSNGILPAWVARIQGTQRQREEQIRELKKRMKDWEPSTVAYILRPDPDGDLAPDSRLREVMIARGTLQSIAQLRNEKTELGGLHSGVELTINAGVIRIDVTSFYAALDRIEAKRIGLCPVCNKLFWAGRIDKSGCSEACSRALRQRRLRERVRENREYKKYLRKRNKEKGNA